MLYMDGMMINGSRLKEAKIMSRSAHSPVASRLTIVNLAKSLPAEGN